MGLSHYTCTMLCKYGKQTCEFWGILILVQSIFYILGAFLIKQLFHSRLLDMRLVIANSALRPHWLFTISYPTRAHGIIVFVKERFHNAVEIDILGMFEGYSSLQIWPPQKIFQGRNYSGRMTSFPSSTCFEPNRSFDLRLGVLPC